MKIEDLLLFLLIRIICISIMYIMDIVRMLLHYKLLANARYVMIKAVLEYI